MNPQINIGIIRVACENAQKEAIREKLKSSYNNTKEKILDYKDNCPFYGQYVKQTTYKNIIQFLNRQSEKGALIRVSKGRGGLASYTFPKDKLSKLIDEVITEERL